MGIEQGNSRCGSIFENPWGKARNSACGKYKERWPKSQRYINSVTYVALGLVGDFGPGAVWIVFGHGCGEI